MAPKKKKVVGLIKLQIQAGQANPAPPVGPALGQHGVNIMEFCKAYNAATETQRGNVIPVEISVYEDRSFTFVLKTPPAARMLLKAAGESRLPPASRCVVHSNFGFSHVSALSVGSGRPNGERAIHVKATQRGVAQLAEQRSPKPQVAGSSPVAPAQLNRLNRPPRSHDSTRRSMR